MGSGATDAAIMNPFTQTNSIYIYIQTIELFMRHQDTVTRSCQHITETVTGLGTVTAFHHNVYV